MSSYIVLIFGADLKPIAAEAFECNTDDTAAAIGHDRARSRDGFGYEVWTSGRNIASLYSVSALTAMGDETEDFSQRS